MLVCVCALVHRLKGQEEVEPERCQQMVNIVWNLPRRAGVITELVHAEGFVSSSIIQCVPTLQGGAQPTRALCCWGAHVQPRHSELGGGG